jgi:DNA repair exonuclease SbcCD nuclease subunit
MKILVFTDLHVHRWSDFALPLADGSNTRLEDGIAVFAKVQRVAEEQKVDAIVFDGDILHRRGVVETFVYNKLFMAVDALATWARPRNIRIVFVPGNHDLAARLHGMSTVVLSFRSLGILVPLTPMQLGWGKDSIGLIPYLDDASVIAKSFKKMRDCSVIFYHGGLSGATTGPLEHKPKEEIDPASLPTKPFIMCGHYHKRQQISEKVWYVGSPMQHCRGDAGDDEKGCCVLDLAKKEITWHNFDFPRFLTRTYPDVAGIEGNFVDVSYDPAKVTLAVVKKAYAAARAELTTPMVVVNDKSSRKRIEVDATFDPHKLMSRYVKKFGEKLDEDKLMELGKQLLGG